MQALALDLPAAVAAEDRSGTVILVDCLTLWVSNLMLAERDVAKATDMLLRCIAKARARIILVSNEVGWGIVPDNPMARRFRDEAGTVNQRVAGVVSQVDLIVSGLAMRLKRRAVAAALHLRDEALIHGNGALQALAISSRRRGGNSAFGGRRARRLEQGVSGCGGPLRCRS